MIISGLDLPGKAKILKLVCSNKIGFKVAVIVEEIDYEWFADSFPEEDLEIEEEFVRFTNGCFVVIAEDTQLEIIKVCKEGLFDHVIVDCEGAIEPMAIAETFTLELSEMSEESKELYNLARVDSCLTVVDCQKFKSQLKSE